MTTINVSPVRLKMMSLLFLGGLIVAGFSGVANQYSMLQIQQDPPILQVPMVQQSRGTSCGEAVISMVYNYAHPETPITEAQVIEYAAANGYFTEAIPPYTSPANMVLIARHYAANVSSGAVTNASQGLSLLIQHLRRGEPIVIDVLSDFSDPSSEAHFIVVTGITVEPQGAVLIHYNDPLTGTQESDLWLGVQGVWNAWKTNDDPGGPGWWLVISPP